MRLLLLFIKVKVNFFFFIFFFIISIAFRVHFVIHLHEENINCTLDLLNKFCNNFKISRIDGGFMLE